MIDSKRILFALAVLFLIIGNSAPTFSQSLASTDLSSVKVENLSDEQILNYINDARNSGYTQTELEAFARQRGMPEAEIANLRRRIAALSGGNLNTGTGQASANVGGRTAVALTEIGIFGKLANSENSNALSTLERKIFGYDLFQSDNLTFAPNLSIPTPDDYILGPGDELNMELWGSADLSTSWTVSPEGTIKPNKLGPIYVSGLSIKAAERRIISRMGQIYGGLRSENGQDPSISYQMTLGRIRTINVTIVGEVNNPGNYALNSLSTVFTALHAAGGPTTQGTFRSVQLLRNNKLKAEIDLYEFLLNGIKQGDQLLRNNDVIIVKPYDIRVELEGETKRPGFFELKKDEKLSEILGFAGGYTSNADRSGATVMRIGTGGREIVDVSASEFESFEPRDGDIYQISSNVDRYVNRVQIEGAIHKAGEYQLTEGLTLKNLIAKARGLRGDAYLIRATIYRLMDDFSQEVISIDLGQLMSGETADVPLVREDVVRINSVYDLKEEYIVEISGEVQAGGVYPFFNRMTVQELIVLAGGLREGASGALIEISRRNNNGSVNSSAEIVSMQIDKSLTVTGETDDQYLRPFDRVFIRRSPGYASQQEVVIEGEVMVPGAYSVSRKDERVSDIVKRAKGLTPYAYPEGAILIRRTEFSSSSTSRINRQVISNLRAKLLSDESGLKNVSRDLLSERLKRIESTSNISAEDDAVGSRFKKNLIEDVAEQDSLIRDVQIPTQEPVALDLVEILESPGSKYDFILRPGDVISIPPKLETVRIAGEVTSPLSLRYDKGYNFKDYIFLSGGFLATAKKGRSYVQYPNGERKGVKRFLFFRKFPKIEPGSTIFVSRKPERSPVNIQSIVAVASSLATLGLLVDRLTQTN